MTYKKPAAESHPLPYGTQARACSVEHGWVFGPVVWRHKSAENGIYIYTVQDTKDADRTVSVAAFQIETQHPANEDCRNESPPAG